MKRVLTNIPWLITTMLAAPWFVSAQPVQSEAARVRDELFWHTRTPIAQWNAAPPVDINTKISRRAEKHDVDLRSDYGARFQHQLLKIEQGQQPDYTAANEEPIIRHLVFGDGRALPKSEAVEAEQKEFYSKLRKSPRSVRQSEVEKEQQENSADGSGATELLKSLTPKALPACTSSSVAARQNNFQYQPGNKDVRFDLLFLKGDPEAGASGARKLDYQELFGERASVWFYTTLPGDRYSLQVTKYGGTCLPYRIRITGEKAFLLSGEAALKNFDVDENGKLHTTVATEKDRFM